jgi:Tol biopolymer transport system component
MWRVVRRGGLICALMLATLPGQAATLVYGTLLWQGDFLGLFKTPGGVKGSIHTIEDTGANDKTLIDLGGGYTSNPQFSPDGQWLYFQSNAGGPHLSVYRSRPDGSEVTNLSALAKLGPHWQDAEAYGFSLSGDGSKIVYTVNNGAASVVYANADGTNARLIAPQLGYIYQAALNQTGNVVVFANNTKGYQLNLVQLPDGQPEVLTPEMTQCCVPQFTPDGKTIVFLHNHKLNPQDRPGDHSDGDLYSLDVVTKQVTQLTHNNKYLDYYVSPTDSHGATDVPSISSDGKQIAYIRLVNGVPQVHTMNLDGSHQQQLTFGPTASGRVVWSPDGKQLAFMTFVDNYPQLFVMDSQGGTPRQLTHISGGCAYVVKWQPTMDRK